MAWPASRRRSGRNGPEESDPGPGALGQRRARRDLAPPETRPDGTAVRRRMARIGAPAVRCPCPCRSASIRRRCAGRWCRTTSTTCSPTASTCGADRDPLQDRFARPFRSPAGHRPRLRGRHPASRAKTMSPPRVDRLEGSALQRGRGRGAAQHSVSAPHPGCARRRRRLPDLAGWRAGEDGPAVAPGQVDEAARRDAHHAHPQTPAGPGWKPQGRLAHLRRERVALPEHPARLRPAGGCVRDQDASANRKS